MNLCLRDPGAEVDLYLRADLGAFAHVWLGDQLLSAPIRSKSVQLTGRRELVRSFPSWLKLNPYAGVPGPGRK